MASTPRLPPTGQALQPEAGFAAPIVLCKNNHRFLVTEAVGRLEVEPKAIILEPVARSTTAPIAVASLAAAREDESAILAVMPSDHVLRNEARFVAKVKQAAKVAATGRTGALRLVSTGAPGHGLLARTKAVNTARPP